MTHFCLFWSIAFVACSFIDMSDCNYSRPSFISSLPWLIWPIISSWLLTISSDFESGLSYLEPVMSISWSPINFPYIYCSLWVQVVLSLCYNSNFFNIFIIKSGDKTGSGRVKAASCQATTIFVISLPENPADLAAINSIVSLLMSSILMSFLPLYKLLGYFQTNAAFSLKDCGGVQYLTR